MISLFHIILASSSPFLSKTQRYRKKLRSSLNQENGGGGGEEEEGDLLAGIDPEKEKTKNLLRFCNFLKKWVTEFFEDFVADEELIQKLFRFFEDPSAKEHPVIMKKLKDSFDRRIEQVQGACGKGGLGDGKEVRVQAARNTSSHNLVQQSERDLSSKGTIKRTKRSLSSKKIVATSPKDLAELSAWDIAQQLTIRDSSLYCSIQSWEVVTPSCLKGEGGGGSLAGLVSHFNRVVLLVSQCILSFENLEKRSKVRNCFIFILYLFFKRINDV